MEWPDGSRLDPQISQIGQRRQRLSSRTQYLREKAGCGISTWDPRSHCIHWQAIDCVSRTASTFWSIFLLSLRTICRSFNVWIAEMGMSRRHKLSKPSTKSCWDNLEAAKWHHSDIWTCWNLLNPQFSSMISQRTKPPFVGEFKPAMFDYTKILYTKRFVHRCAVQAADFHSKTYQSTLTLWFTFQLHWKIPKLDTRNVPALRHTHQTFFDGGAILALPMYFPQNPQMSAAKPLSFLFNI